MDTPALPRAGRVARVTVATGLAALLLAACGASHNMTDSGSAGSSSETADMAVPEQQADAEAEYTEEGTESAERGADGNVGSDVEITDRQLIHIADMTVRVEDVAEASDLAKALAVEVGGYVADESLSTPATGTPEAYLTLRIPNEDYESSLDALAELGDRSTLERSVEDVTEEVADVESRIESSEAALETLRGYLEEAQDVDDLLRVEGEIQRRQADLEAFQARLKSLENQTSYSTVHLQLMPPATYIEEPSQDSVGFLGGLERGWLALVALGQGLSVIVGWLLPFAVVAVVLGAWPLWLWRQRRRAHRKQREQNATMAVPAGATAQGTTAEGSEGSESGSPYTDEDRPGDQC
ncbi:DUF4349 domain-containing protein [Nocardiopsis valliformis]|uniref:DUF4349 domain-containing protein n=1 Tax=Nocardiopsis valliformis TaxID=239974 RepID=UPI0003807AF2|nr:DUF4349 domain-containing protein [Nocardiopsis valliformis]